MIVAALLGALLGMLSRLEESSFGLRVGVSSDAVWLGVAFVVGVVARRPGAGRAAASGSLAMTAANASYYTWIAVTEHGGSYAGMAGKPAHWFVLGVLGGAVFAFAGHIWARSGGAVRVAAILPLAAVWIVDGVARGGTAGGLSTALGAVFPVASAGRARERILAAALSAATVAIALTGRLEAFLP